MKQELIDQLRAQHPDLWGQAPFFCGDGWFDILRRLGDDLASKGVTFYAVIEKRGGLAFGTLPEELPPGVNARLAEAAHACHRVCEECGQPGRKVMNRALWEATRCQAHQGNATPYRFRTR